MPISDYDRKYFGEIVAGAGDWFSAHLIRLYAKADQYNRANLASAYPEVRTAYEAWYAATNPDVGTFGPPLDLDKVRHFLRYLADLTLDGEVDEEGEPDYEMPNDDAWSSIHDAVRTSRRLLGEEPERPFVREPMPGDEEEEK